MVALQCWWRQSDNFQSLLEQDLQKNELLGFHLCGDVQVPYEQTYRMWSLEYFHFIEERECSQVFQILGIQDWEDCNLKQEQDCWLFPVIQHKKEGVEHCNCSNEMKSQI